ncbi:surfeit locus protein 6 isoform X2 [Saimiri boliviensis]|uniref:surfeit locus protein 6 isoform X2 n=1 Tax=Saimiri boliviensis TaxID=27679 RepID=UPI003D7816B0
MASLLAKDTYLQSLARKICARPGPQPQARTRAGKTQGPETAGPPKKKRKKTQKKFREREEKAAERKAKSLGEKSPAASGARKPEADQGEAVSASSSAETPAGGLATEPESLFALDVLRQRLHEKIQEARGQGSAAELSPAALEKRQRRKQERDRKKRKRKELRAKEKARKAEEAAEAQEPVEPVPEGAGGAPREPAGLIFNKLSVDGFSRVSQKQRGHSVSRGFLAMRPVPPATERPCLPHENSEEIVEDLPGKVSINLDPEQWENWDGRKGHSRKEELAGRGGSHLQSQHFERLRQADHLRLGVEEHCLPCPQGSLVEDTFSL